MNVEQLRQTIRGDYLNDVESDYIWSDSFLLRALNEAERQACNRSNLIFDSSTYSITLVNGTASYTLNANVNEIEYVGFEGNEIKQKSKHELQRTTPAWRTQSGMTNKTVNYIMRGRVMTFVPKPDATDDAKTVSLEVYRMPTTAMSADTDTPEIAEEYHRDLIYWVLYEAYSNPNIDAQNKDLAQMYRNQFDSVFGEYISAEVRFNRLEQDKTLRFRPIAYATRMTLNDITDDFGDP